MKIGPYDPDTALERDDRFHRAVHRGDNLFGGLGVIGCAAVFVALFFGELHLLYVAIVVTVMAIVTGVFIDTRRDEHMKTCPTMRDPR